MTQKHTHTHAHTQTHAHTHKHTHTSTHTHRAPQPEPLDEPFSNSPSRVLPLAVEGYKKKLDVLPWYIAELVERQDFCKNIAANSHCQNVRTRYEYVESIDINICLKIIGLFCKRAL